MLRTLLLIVLSTATANAVAVPPYEPLPARTEKSAASSSNANSTNVSPKSSDNGFIYAPAVDNTSASAAASAATPSWEMFSQMQQMQEELQQLRGTVEELSHQIDIMQKQERERYLDLDMRINQMQSGSAANKTVAPQTAAPAAKVDEKTLYQQASDQRKNNQFPQAIATLESLLMQAPNGLYAPYSEYWLGELYMVSDPVDLDQAKRHFINLLANYPDHVKVPDGMFKLGKLYASKGESAKAKSTLNELVKKHPDKSASRLARELLKTL
jgi:tol-pal system protein YbgF